MDFEGAFRKLSSEVAEKNGIDESDYVKDGLLYCGICNTPKQTRITLAGKEITVNSICKHKSDESKADLQRIRDTTRKSLADERRSWLLKRKRFINSTFDIDRHADSKASIFSRDYVEKVKEYLSDNIGIAFTGECDSGKTFYSACIANALIDKGYSCYMRTESDLLNELFESEDKTEYIEYIASVDFLIIDDFGCARDTPYALEQIKNIIDARYNNEKPLIISTNLNSDFFSNKNADLKYKRIISRINEMCVFVNLKSTGERKENKKAKVEAMNKLLNS